MDRLSKKSKSIPTKKCVDARRLIQLFLEHWVSNWGWPDSIVSDSGPQFVSSLWREICRLSGTKIKLSTAYNPHVDGQTEIMNQYMKQRLRLFVKFYQDNWSEMSPLLDLAQLLLPYETTKITSLQVCNGFEPLTS